MSTIRAKKPSKAKPQGLASNALVRRGFGVELTRDDGTTFLALAGGGILPFVHVHRKWAVDYKRQMQWWGFKARVVPVTFTYPAPNEGAELTGGQHVKSTEDL